MKKPREVRIVHCRNHACFKMWQKMIAEETPRGSSEQSSILGGLFTHLNAGIQYNHKEKVLLSSVQGIIRHTGYLYNYYLTN